MADTMQTEEFPYLPSGLAEVNKMIEEHSDLFSDSQCKVCSAVLISNSQKLTHYQSKKHANKVRRYFFIQNEKEPTIKKPKSPSSDNDCNNGDSDRSKVCHVCNMIFSSPVIAESHYQGKVHAKNLRLQTVGPQTPAVPQTTPTTTVQNKKESSDDSKANDDTNTNLFCSVCQASFFNQLMAQQHYEGKKHKKHLKKLKLMETYGLSSAPASSVKGYPCDICKIQLNSVEQYQSHISGAKHKNQLKKSGLTPSDSLQTSDPSFSSENEYSSSTTPYSGPEHDLPPADEQYAHQDEQYGPQDEQYGPQDEQYGPQDEQYAPQDEQHYELGDNSFIPTDDQYPEQDTEYQ